MAWTVEFDPDAVKDLKKRDKQIQARILDFLRERLARLDNPREPGEALASSKLGNYWKIPRRRLAHDLRFAGSAYRRARASCGAIGVRFAASC